VLYAGAKSSESVIVFGYPKSRHPCGYGMPVMQDGLFKFFLHFC
jgi:hypothetical protein